MNWRLVIIFFVFDLKFHLKWSFYIYYNFFKLDILCKNRYLLFYKQIFVL